MRRVVVVALALAAAPGTAHAASGSLSYANAGDVYVAAPDGSRATRVTTDGGYAWPSQSDDGTLVAVRERLLHRFDRNGARVGAPIETMPPGRTDFVGPLAPQVSPDGTIVAYHYFNTGVLSERTRTSVAYTRTDAGTQPGVFGGALGGYLTPSWTADGRVLVFYGAQRTSHVGIDTPGDGYVDWFGDPAVETLLTNGELTRAGDRLVAVGDQNDLRFYDAGSGTPALRCVTTGFNGNVGDPTWSPEGDALAWEEADGIHAAELGDLGACGSAARRLVVPGGQDPDWGPAAAPAVSAPPAPAGGSALRIDVAGWRGSLKARRTLSVRTHCSASCALTATLTTRFGRIATARGTGTLRLRLSAAVVRRIVRARRMDATLTVSAGNVRVVRRVRLTR